MKIQTASLPACTRVASHISRPLTRTQSATALLCLFSLFAAANPAARAQSAASPHGDTPTLPRPIELRMIYSGPVSMYMVEDTKVIYEALSKITGLHILFDPDYTSTRITVELRNVAPAEAFRIVAEASGTSCTPVSPHTCVVVRRPATR